MSLYCWCLVFHLEWCVRQLWCSAIICNITGIAHNQYTDIYSQTYIFTEPAGGVDVAESVGGCREELSSARTSPERRRRVDQESRAESPGWGAAISRKINDITSPIGDTRNIESAFVYMSKLLPDENTLNSAYAGVTSPLFAAAGVGGADPDNVGMAAIGEAGEVRPYKFIFIHAIIPRS